MRRLQEPEMTMAVGVGAEQVRGREEQLENQEMATSEGLTVLEMTTAAVTRGNKGSFCSGCAGQGQQQKTRVSLPCQVGVSTGRGSVVSASSRGI